MAKTDKLIEHFDNHSGVEVDHVVTLYIRDGDKIPYTDMMKIKEYGYKVQDVSTKNGQAKVTLVR